MVAANGIALTVTANPDPAAPGGLVTYEIKISNLGAAMQSNLTLTDTTQNGASGLLSYSFGSPTCPNSTVGGQCPPGLFMNWPAFALAPGQTQTLSMTSAVAAATTNGTIIHNTATVAFTGGSIMQKTDVLVDGTQSLHLSITEDHDPVQSGDQLTYTITVGNTGTQTLPLSAAGGVSAAVPVGTTFVSASNAGTASNGIVQWSIGSVDPGANQHYSFTVTVGTLADGTILAPTAQVLDGTTSLARAMTDTEVRAISPVKLTVSANPDPAAPGELVTYEIKVSNLGTATLSNLKLTDVTQNGASGLLSYSAGDATCPNSTVGGQCPPGLFMIWPAFSLAPGQTQTVSMTSAVGAGAANGIVIRNHAIVTYPTGSVSQRQDIAVDGTQRLHVSMTEDHDPVQPGDQITYAITVGNTGTQSLPVSAAGVLTVVVPAGTTFGSASRGGSASSGIVKWSIGSVNPGANQHYSFTATVGPLTDGAVLQSTAQLLDGTTSLARTMTGTEVRAVSPLKLTVTANPDPVVAGGLVTYEIKVSNLGTATLSNLTLDDVTQNALSGLLSYSAGGATCPNSTVGGQCPAGLFMIWPAFSLAPGQTQTVSMTSAVGAGAANGTVVRNHVMLGYTGGSVSQRHDIVVDGGQSLHLSMTEDHDPVQPGDQVTYTITMGNTGTQSLPTSAAGVLTASVPAGTTFVFASNGGTASSGIVQWTFGAVNPGGNQHYSFTVTVGTASDGSVLQSMAQLLDGTTSLVRANTGTEVRAVSPLKLTMTVNPDPAVANAPLAYQITVSNLGSATLSNLTLTDVTQNAASGILAYSNGSVACPNSTVGGQCPPGLFLVWPVFSLAPGQTETVLATSLVGSGAPNGTVIRNHLMLGYTGGTVSQRHDVVVDGTQNLHLSMTGDRFPAKPGDQVTYVIGAGNRGTLSLPQSGSGVLTAVVPAGTTFVSASNGGAAANGLVTWNVGSINPGTDQRYSFVVAVGTTVSDAVVLQSTAQLLDGTASLARAMTDTEVRANSPLQLAVAVTPDPAAPATLVIYTLTVTNSGTASYTNVLVTDMTENNGSGILADTTGGATCPNSNVGGQCPVRLFLDWPAFALGPGGTQVFSATVQVTAGTLNGTEIRNVARVDYPGGTVITSGFISVHQ